MQKKHRIFIAINLPIEVKKQILKYEEKWSALPARWAIEDNLHITLSFLGYLTDTEIGEASIAVKKAVENYNSFEISLNKICYGPLRQFTASSSLRAAPQGKLEMPRMVWLMGEKSKELSSLRRDIENALASSIGFKPEIRSFSPHITLSKIKMMEFRNLDLEERPEVNENVNLGFEVSSIEVMESELKRGGPTYTVIESYQLI